MLGCFNTTVLSLTFSLASEDPFSWYLVGITSSTVFNNHFETVQVSFKCSLDVHMTLGLQSDNCLAFFTHFELSKFSSPNSIFVEPACR